MVASTWRTPILALIILSGIACSTPQAESEPVPDYAKFTRALEAGASCEELFEIRNSIDPKSPDMKSMNEDLQFVGCFSRSSTRTPQEEADDRVGVDGRSFTVMEYRLYRALIDSLTSVSKEEEDRAARRVGEQYGIPPEEVYTAAEKVPEILSRNGWFGIPKSEIRHASDWQGEQP